LATLLAGKAREVDYRQHNGGWVNILEGKDYSHLLIGEEIQGLQALEKYKKLPTDAQKKKREDTYPTFIRDTKKSAKI